MQHLKRILPLIIALSAALSWLGFTPTATAQSTAFTYKGRLDVSGAAVSGSYDLAFALFDAAGGVCH